MHGKCLLSLLGVGFILSASATVAQEPPITSVVVNGQIVDIGVAQMQGRPYVDVEQLAQAMGALVTIARGQITLNLPRSPSAVARPVAPTSAGAAANLSTRFQQLALPALGVMREGQGTIRAAVDAGAPVTAALTDDYHERVAAGLLEATLAASTPEDSRAVQLLQNEYAFLSDWSSHTGKNEELLSFSKISNCGDALVSMIATGTVQDDSSCH